MEDRGKTQRKDNSGRYAALMVCDISEALWRLRVAATAAEMVRTLPEGSLTADDQVDLLLATSDR